MHLHQCFSKVFEPNVTFSGTAGGPSGRDRRFADASNEKGPDFQRFCRVAIAIPLVPHLGGGSPVWWTIHQRCEKPLFSQRFPTFWAKCFLFWGVLFRPPCENTTFYNVLSMFPVTYKHRCGFTRGQPAEVSTFHVSVHVPVHI